MLPGRKQFTFYLSRLKGLLLAPGREWEVIRDERPGGVRLLRGFIVSPCACLSLAAILLRWATAGSLPVAFLWGLINFLACVIGYYITFRVTRRVLEPEVDRAGHVAFQLVTYTFAVYLIFRSLSAGFPPRSIAGELMAVLSLYSLYTLYTGASTVATLSAARKQNVCIIAGAAVAALPFFIARLLALAFRVPIVI
ncbi:MAG: hypothetical protein LBG30_03775 [Odoribacteraceae bacterium]|jgi:hypothetical protein|nr:hypothetical protein [Odoribacteraceae bacterium]